MNDIATNEREEWTKEKIAQDVKPSVLVLAIRWTGKLACCQNYATDAYCMCNRDRSDTQWDDKPIPQDTEYNSFEEYT
jgi:hypothetical protein